MATSTSDPAPPDYLRALALVLGKDALRRYDADALARLEPAVLTRLLADNGYRGAIEAMAEYARTFTVVMPQYEPLAAWLASYAWGYGHHICIAWWGSDASRILSMMGRYVNALMRKSPPILQGSQLTLYRGQLVGAPLGWSWTRDPAWAATFLKEWDQPGEVLQLNLEPSKILAVICDHADAEGHEEYVVDPVVACAHFPAYQPMNAAAARALIDEEFAV